MVCSLHVAVLATLVRDDLILLCLTYIHLTATDTVPICLLVTPTSGHTHPATIASKVPCFTVYMFIQCACDVIEDDIQCIWHSCLGTLPD